MGKIRAPPTNAVLAVPATLSWGGPPASGPGHDRFRRSRRLPGSVLG